MAKRKLHKKTNHQATLTMKLTSLLRHLSVLPAMMLLTTVTYAGSTQEPRRIFDLESGNFIDNPDYHESAAEVRAARTNPPYHEPRRVYDLEKKQFVENPDYHEPVVQAPAPKRPANYEPRRMYDAETGQYVMNPDYREPKATAAPESVRLVATESTTKHHVAPGAHKMVIAHRRHTPNSGHQAA